MQHRIRCPLAFRLALVLLLCLTSAAMAENPGSIVSGDYHQGEYDGNCNRMDGTMERNWPGYHPVPEYTFAFYGGEATNEDLCLTVLMEESGTSMGNLAWVVSELEGTVVEELMPPFSYNPAPLADCWPVSIHVEDFDHNRLADILLLISCRNTRTGQREFDNTLYMGQMSEGLAWLRQRDDVNQRIAKLTDYWHVREALHAAFEGGSTQPYTPSAPTPPLPGSLSTQPPGPSSGQSTADIPPYPASPYPAQPSTPQPPSYPPPNKTPQPPSTPPPPPSSPPPSDSGYGGGLSKAPMTTPVAPQEDAEYCRYDTEWGELTLLLNYTTGAVSGYYPYEDGRVAGTMRNNITNGWWTQRDGEGVFEFHHSRWGFEGWWGFEEERNWRGEWNGRIIECWSP